MKSPRTPLGLALAQLIETLVDGILEATRGASLHELELEDERKARSLAAAARAEAPARRATATASKRATRRARRDAESSTTKAFAKADEWHDDGPVPATEIDAVALLDSLERPAPAREAPEPRAKVEKTETVAEPRPAISRPALRSGEEVLQTTTGSVVLRRRRAATVDE